MGCEGSTRRSDGLLEHCRIQQGYPFGEAPSIDSEGIGFHSIQTKETALNSAPGSPPFGSGFATTWREVFPAQRVPIPSDGTTRPTDSAGRGDFERLDLQSSPITTAEKKDWGNSTVRVEKGKCPIRQPRTGK